MSKRTLIIIAAVVVIALIIFTTILLIYMVISSGKKKDKQSTKKIKKQEDSLQSDKPVILSQQDMVDYLSSERKNVRALCAADGIDTSALSYNIIYDGGRDCYVCGMYADKLPNRSIFARTYRDIMNFPGCTTSVFINPLTQAESEKILDKRVIALGSELIAAERGADRNRYRKINQKMQECEEWAKVIEGGLNVFFKVGFLFELTAQTLEELNDICAEFYSLGKEKNIDLVGCYGAQAEAILASAPLNNMMKVGSGLYKDRLVKYHIMDKNALGDIFNHTESYFSHKDGILAGRNMYTAQPVLIDPYDRSHSGYNICISGMTGVGKSAGLKMWLARWIEVFNYRLAVIDFDAPNGTTQGEYVNLVTGEGGVVFQLKHNTESALNPFDIDVEYEYIRELGTEVAKLNLSEKQADCTSVLLTMIKGGKSVSDFKMNVYLEKIIRETIIELYDQKGIEDGKPDSIYSEGQQLENGRLVSGMVRKEMPTIHDFYIRVLNRKRFNSDPLQEEAYSLVIAGIEPYVKECYYSEKSIGEYSAEAYDALPVDENALKYVVIGGQRERVYAVRGTKPYFDGQSTISVTPDTQCLDIDISQLPEGDRDVAQQVACSFVNEYFIKKNSNDPRRVQRCAVVVDEFHKTFQYEETLNLIESLYRQARKRYVSMITLTQALADYSISKQTEAIVKNASMKVLYKQAIMDMDFIRKVTPLTESQIDSVVKLGGSLDASGVADNSRKGECCLIDNEDTVVFMKVDYLRTEAKICETDPEKIAKMMGGRRTA